MSTEDAVGFGRPPKATQFKKGKSGNPTGRPKGSRNLSTLMDAELKERIQLREGGTHKSVRKDEALVKAMVNKGIGGDIRAASKVIEMAALLDPAAAVAVRHVPMTPEDYAVLREFLEVVRRAPSVEIVLAALKEPAQ